MNKFSSKGASLSHTVNTLLDPFQTFRMSYSEGCPLGAMNSETYAIYFVI